MLALAARSGWCRAGCWRSTCSTPTGATSRRPHGRWLEREPGIIERADWHPADRSLTLRVRAGGREAAMELWWLEPDGWGRLLAEAGFDQVKRYGGFNGEPLAADGADSVWLARVSGSAGG